MDALSSITLPQRFVFYSDFESLDRLKIVWFKHRSCMVGLPTYDLEYYCEWWTEVWNSGGIQTRVTH